MKYAVWNLLLFPIMALCMTACSSDDSEPVSTNNTISAPMVNGKRLVKIKYGDTYTSLEYNSQGQVSKVKYHSKDGTTREDSYWYEDRRVIWSPQECVFNLANGHVEENNYTVLPSYESSHTVDIKEKYTYDYQGYLIEATRPYDFTEDHPIERKYTYSWNDDNIISVTESESNDGLVLFEHSIKYTSIENNIPLFFTYFYSNNIFLEWQGYFGKRCKNLPERITITNHTMEPSWDGYSITYTYNYITEEVLITEMEVESTTNKGTSSKDAYELEWW